MVKRLSRQAAIALALFPIFGLPGAALQPPPPMALTTGPLPLTPVRGFPEGEGVGG